jgi:fermentation-respiration switch protein FrsA (DUF1100 family)
VKLVVDIVLPLTILYGCVVGGVSLFQSHLIYYPHIGRDMVATPRTHGLDYEEVELTADDGEKLAAWWVPVAQPRGTILMFHGNAGNISHRIDYLRMFHRIGYSSLIIDYRGYGRSTGTPSEEGTYRDALAAWRHLTTQRGVAPADIVLFGESLGGAVASWLAARHAPRALVMASTFTSVPDLGQEIYWFLPVRLISRFSYDNLANLKAIDVPVMIAHSRGDEIVPFSHGERLYAAARTPKVMLELRGGHNDGLIFMRDEWVRALAEFLNRHAPRSGGRGAR